MCPCLQTDCRAWIAWDMSWQGHVLPARCREERARQRRTLQTLRSLPHPLCGSSPRRVPEVVACDPPRRSCVAEIARRGTFHLWLAFALGSFACFGSRKRATSFSLHLASCGTFQGSTWVPVPSDGPSVSPCRTECPCRRRLSMKPDEWEALTRHPAPRQNRRTATATGGCACTVTVCW